MTVYLINSVVILFGKIKIIKKLLGILILGLLWCNIAKAKECEGSPFVEKKRTLIFFKKFAKWKDCHGSFTFKNGSKYVGNFKDGKFSGRGTFTWEKGKFAGENYVGEFLKGKRSGLGSHTFANGDIDYGIWIPRGRGTRCPAPPGTRAIATPRLTGFARSSSRRATRVPT